jgi:hypothetical protein
MRFDRVVRYGAGLMRHLHLVALAASVLSQSGCGTINTGFGNAQVNDATIPFSPNYKEAAAKAVEGLPTDGALLTSKPQAIVCRRHARSQNVFERLLQHGVSSFLPRTQLRGIGMTDSESGQSVLGPIPAICASVSQ